MPTNQNKELAVQYKWVLAALVIASLPATSVKAQDNVTICDFEHFPPFSIALGGGMGAGDNTLTVGDGTPMPMSVGSSLMTASDGRTEYTISFSPPASVTVFTAGNSDSRTFFGSCGSEATQVSQELSPITPSTGLAAAMEYVAADDCAELTRMLVAYAELSFRASKVVRDLSIDAMMELIDDPESARIKTEILKDIGAAVNLDMKVVSPGLRALKKICPD